MCSRPEHRIEVLPDGQTDEAHIFTDVEGLPHIPFDHDVDGVPYAYPTCGLCGEWWPCEEVGSDG